MRYSRIDNKHNRSINAFLVEEKVIPCNLLPEALIVIKSVEGLIKKSTIRVHYYKISGIVQKACKKEKV